MTDPAAKSESYLVVRNQTGRTSCWPAGRPVPNGWKATGVAGTKQHCLDAISRPEPPAKDEAAKRRLDMSLMFFGDSESDRHGEKYRLLFEAARFADQNGFSGVWLPERHFNRFGCLYPNPAILHAALARETTNLRLRAGSVVLPLNDTLRVVEQWSMVDNLSQGRAEIAIASGWHADDFALMPDAYHDRAERMLRGIDDIETLWSGQTIRRRNGAGQPIDVRTYPTPVQPRLPIWLTAAGNPETFRLAGTRGYDVLTHLFHQNIDQLAEKIDIYRNARRDAGLDESTGRVAVTLHTFVGESTDEVRRKAGQAYCDYLKSNLSLLQQLAFSQGQSMDVASLPKDEMDQMIQWLLNKFIGGRSLMGTVDTCTKTCEELASVGVNEIACLLDFGPDTDDVLSHLPFLARLSEVAANLPNSRGAGSGNRSVETQKPS